MNAFCASHSHGVRQLFTSSCSRAPGQGVHHSARKQRGSATARRRVALTAIQASAPCTGSSGSPWQAVQAHWIGAALCGLIVWQPQPLQAAPLPPSLVLLDSNAAIVGQLKQLQQTKQKFGTQDPGAALAARFAGAQQQLQRIETLVKIQQYDTARMQLRQGSFKSLRSDLRYESEYRGVTPELARDIVEGVERLDRQLRGQEPTETITQGLKQLQGQLQQLVDQAQPPQ